MTTLRVLLCLMFALVSSSVYATAASDNFNRANESPLTSPWATESGFSGIYLASNAVKAAGANTSSFSRYDSGTWDPDQWAEVTYGTVDADTGGPAVRMTGSGNGYFVTFNSGLLKVFRASGFIAVGTQPAVSVTTGDVVRLEINGTSLEVFKNTVSVWTATDSGIASGKPGIFSYDGTTTMDNFNAEDVNGAGGGTKVNPISGRGGTAAAPIALGN